MVDAELEDWEKELENDTPTLNSSEVKKIIVESEEIIKPKFEPKPKEEPKINLDDYEIKWQEKNKELIERRRKEEEATQGLSEKDKQKKLIDMRIISDATDFLEGKEKGIVRQSTTQELLPLVTEKDFIDLSVSTASRIKAANKPSQFTLKFLKNNIELLAPTLDGDKLDVLIKDLTILFNKKVKEKSVTTKTNVNKSKPTQSAGKGLERAEKMGALDDYGGRDDLGEDDYEEDDFI